ncbi:YybH family protein [Actinokineospora sp.]|uniref:YybH family protein n=1 Tax=Actinokineospora sp. TaxID=1872133 RepID=UPI004037A837
MKKISALLTVVGITTVLSAPAQALPSDTDRNRNRTIAECQRRFDDTVRRYDEAFLARDLDRLMSFYRDDATKIDPNGDIQLNKQEIAGLFGQLFQLNFTASFPHVKKVVDCDTALLVTDSTLVFPDFEYQEHFFSSLTYTADDRGRWRVLVSASTGLTSTN